MGKLRSCEVVERLRATQASRTGEKMMLDIGREILEAILVLTVRADGEAENVANPVQGC